MAASLVTRTNEMLNPYKIRLIENHLIMVSFNELVDSKLLHNSTSNSSMDKMQ